MPAPIHPLRTALHRRWVVLTSGAAIVALAGVGTTAAVAATTPPPVASAASATPCAPPVHALLRALPGSLRSDLRHLRKDATSHRAADRAEIERKALAGDYGPEARRLAAIASGSRGGRAPALPAALKADLKVLRADAKGSAARKAEAATIWRKALAGDYGSAFQAAAKRAEARAQQRCASRSTGGGS